MADEEKKDEIKEEQKQDEEKVDVDETESTETKEDDDKITTQEPDNKLVIRRNIFVDMWAFLGMHATNINIVQKLKTAEDRQFTFGMDVNGKISEDPAEDEIGKKEREDIALMAIRSNLWEPPKEDKEKALGSYKKKVTEKLRKKVKRTGGRLNKEQKEKLEEKKDEADLDKFKPNDIDKKRLVIKMFSTTGKKIHWKGTVEELSSREIHNSMGSNHPLVTLNVILPGYDYLITIQQNLKYFALAPIYSFFYWDEKMEKMWYVVIKQRFISIGIDFDVYAEDRKIAFIDGKLIGLGGNSSVKIYDEYLAKDKKFGDILVLFTSTVGYLPHMRRAIKKRIKSLERDGNNIHIVEDEEFWMLKNPRRLIR